ncbi:anthranilate N-hydroxycinamoyl/bensoiltransferase-like family protein [Hibiscus syriacus]|uniref:Anthranilate N-hydroxycinamoyl/bensoiltransferase-like family protein n=1 Tax=Hibiscus syriacus TaxID=106335 RepID=A0A6A2XFL3_HIBSY|nr:uncharacterized acetyltransferase At3g50280-like [Hibiscus syriacus]KAE8674543.1 anthranilate N-hydroxycinamoyl/bensoiltransferase-like family protein [Hibiscus syriacus]
MDPSTVRVISECFVRPQNVSDESKQPFYLTPWDLIMLSVQYIQKGLLFAKPPPEDCGENSINDVLERLKKSLDIALRHFYPLAGRIVAKKEENPPSYSVFVDCNNSPGAKFIHAAADISVSDIVSPTYVPLVVQSFFDHDRAINYDGQTRPLLSIQVTELVDGVFIGCSMNHAIGDGTSFWHFFNALSEIFQSQDDNVKISRPPVFERWFPEGYGPLLKLPFAHEDEFISTFEAPQLLERIFHFSAESIAELKKRANTEYRTTKISSFQSLSAFVWRAITRARRFSSEMVIGCRLAINNRSRLEPPLSPDYFGNSIQTVRAVTTAGELLEHDLGWAAWKLHQAVVNHTDESVRGFVNDWLRSPSIYQISQLFDPQSVMMGSSPRFNKYGNEFGLGKALTLRSGYAHKFDGKVSSYPGRQGGGSIDLEVCLPPSSMNGLESDEEFMAAVSSLSPM